MGLEKRIEEIDDPDIVEVCRTIELVLRQEFGRNLKLAAIPDPYSYITYEVNKPRSQDDFTFGASIRYFKDALQAELRPLPLIT